MFVNYVNNEYITNIAELKMKINIAKHIEKSFISFEFSDKFKIEEISDDIIISMFENIENRILGVDGNTFIFIHRLSDNKISKSIITDDNK